LEPKIRCFLVNEFQQEKFINFSSRTKTSKKTFPFFFVNESHSTTEKKKKFVSKIIYINRKKLKRIKMINNVSLHFLCMKFNKRKLGRININKTKE